MFPIKQNRCFRRCLNIFGKIFNITNDTNRKKFGRSTTEMKFDKEFLSNKLKSQLSVLMKMAWDVCKHEL